MVRKFFFKRGLYVGQVVQKNTHLDMCKINIVTQKMDYFLKMYFPYNRHVWVEDNKPNSLDIGDLVLVTKKEDASPKELNMDKYRVVKRIFKVGETVDPVTGKPCRGLEFIDPENRKMEPFDVKP